jgi:hypothetical protein
MYVSMRLTSVSCSKVTIDEGIGPDKRLNEKFKLVSIVRLLILSGMGPVVGHNKK